MWRKPTWSSRLHSWITRPIATRWTWFAEESFPRSGSGIDNLRRLWARVEKCWPHRRDDRNPSLTPELFAKANGRTPWGPAVLCTVRPFQIWAALIYALAVASAFRRALRRLL